MARDTHRRGDLSAGRALCVGGAVGEGAGGADDQAATLTAAGQAASQPGGQLG